MSFGPLVSPSALVAPPPGLVLLDCRRGAALYAQGHLPGACHADLDAALSTASQEGFDPAPEGRHPLPPVADFAARLGTWGIGPETPVLAYDGASGGDGAARLWWMLRALGHDPVGVLDGGLPAALAAGCPLSTVVPTPSARPPYPASTWNLPLADVEEVDRRRTDPAWKVLDVRSAARWRGEEEPFDPPGGRIPGSVNLPWTGALDAEGRLLPPALLRERFLTVLAGTPPERTVVHCGSGVTACHTLLAFEVAGLSGAHLYLGSFSQWCRQGRPIARG